MDAVAKKKQLDEHIYLYMRESRILQIVKKGQALAYYRRRRRHVYLQNTASL